MPPYVLLSLLLGVIYGVLFHLWRGRSIKDLLIFLLAGIVGFGLGQIAGNLIAFDLLRLGPIYLLEATLVSWVALFLAQWLKI